MRMGSLVAVAASMTLLSSGASFAQPVTSPDVAQGTAAATQGITSQQRARLAEKLQLVSQVMRQVESSGNTVTAEQRQWLLESLYRMSLGQVRAMGAPGNYAAAADTVTRVSKLSAKALGDQGDDLVYTPFNPCRYIDTRSVGGKINGVAGYDLANTGNSYGGAAACDPRTLLNIANEDLIGAIALNMTIVDTSGAASPGFATVRPAGSTNTTALVNWTVSSAGFQLGNAAVVSTAQGGGANEFEILTSGAVHAIVDFFGAFIMPGATAFQCVTTTPVVVNVANGGIININANACPAGYTEVSLSCHAQITFGGTEWIGFGARTNGTGDCQGANGSGGAQDYQAVRTCCRVPGR